MQITHTTAERLVLSTDRRLFAFIGIVAAPLVIWLGLLIVGEGDTEWFGYTFAALGVILGLGGIAAVFVRLSLVLDRPEDLIRFTIRGPFRRRHRTVPLSALERVEVRLPVANRMEHPELVFVPRPETALREVKITEFWTASAAHDAHAAVTLWLEKR